MNAHTGRPLTGRTIAISISEPADLATLGFGPEHLTDAMIELARGLLGAGATLAYGGDLRPGGFTHTLLDLARATATDDEPARSRIVSYLAWPVWRSLPPGDIAMLKNLITAKELPAPGGQAGPSTPDPTTAEGSAAWATALTAMREKMAEDTDARVILGGRLTGSKGRLPGIVEEAILTLRAAPPRPLYVLGGFGGASAAVANALRGEEPLHPTCDELRDDRIDDHDNGLDDEENDRLMTTVHVPEMVALVLKGLATRLSPPTKQG